MRKKCLVLEILDLVGKSGVLKREGKSVPGTGKDPDMGKEQEDKKTVPEASLSRAVRTVDELGWKVVEPCLALPLREVAFILWLEYSRSQELSWEAGLREKAGPGSPTPLAVPHSWAPWDDAATPLGLWVQVRAGERHCASCRTRLLSSTDSNGNASGAAQSGRAKDENSGLQPGQWMSRDPQNTSSD